MGEAGTGPAHLTQLLPTPPAQAEVVRIVKMIIVLIVETQIIFLGSVHKLTPSLTNVVCQDTWLMVVLCCVRHVGR